MDPTTHPAATQTCFAETPESSMGLIVGAVELMVGERVGSPMTEQN